MKVIYPLVIALFILQTSCTTDSEKINADVNELEQLNELMEAVETEPEEELIGWRKFFDIKVPPRMNEMTELNREAIAQFGYVDQMLAEDGNGEVLEHYLIVMMEDKDSIAGYPIELEIDVMSYRNDAVRALEEGERIEEFIVLNEPTIENINGMDCIKNEMKAVLGGYDSSIELYYQLGIYESENAFYQVLTWCIAGQKEQFKKDMEISLNSFREKG